MTPETFNDLLHRCLADGETEEGWAYAHGLAPRTLRRAKNREHRLTPKTLDRLAEAMRALGGRKEARITRIARATAPVE